MIVGFFIFGVFLVYAVIMLLHDDRKRHKDYDDEILRCKSILQTKYNCDEAEVQRMMDDFAAEDRLIYKTAY